jgi:hypothetical protein
MICPNPDCPDIELFNVQGEYGKGVETCPKCGTRLVAGPEPPDEPPVESHDDDGEPVSLGLDELEGCSILLHPDLAEISSQQVSGLVPLAAYRYRHEAAVECALLHSAGIPAVVVADDVGSLNPALCLLHEAYLWIREPDLEDAEQALDTKISEPVLAEGGTDLACDLCELPLSPGQLYPDDGRLVHPDCARREQVLKIMMRWALFLLLGWYMVPIIGWFLPPIPVILAGLVLVMMSWHPTLHLQIIRNRAALILVYTCLVAGILMLHLVLTAVAALRGTENGEPADEPVACVLTIGSSRLC